MKFKWWKLVFILPLNFALIICEISFIHNIKIKFKVQFDWFSVILHQSIKNDVLKFFITSLELQSSLLQFLCFKILVTLLSIMIMCKEMEDPIPFQVFMTWSWRIKMKKFIKLYHMYVGGPRAITCFNTGNLMFWDTCHHLLRSQDKVDRWCLVHVC